MSRREFGVHFRGFRRIVTVLKRFRGVGMSIFSGILGHASEFSLEKARETYAPLVAEGEQIEHAYKLIRDVFLFTNRRLILIDKQGVTGRKTEYLSIPYRSIVRFSIESAGTFDLDAELKIWMSGVAEPIKKTFNKSVNIYALQSVLAAYVAR